MFHRKSHGINALIDTDVERRLEIGLMSRLAVCRTSVSKIDVEARVWNMVYGSINLAVRTTFVPQIREATRLIIKSRRGLEK